MYLHFGLRQNQPIKDSDLIILTLLKCKKRLSWHEKLGWASISELLQPNPFQVAIEATEICIIPEYETSK